VLIELGADRYQCFPTGYVGMLFPCLLFFRPGGAAATPEQVASGRAAQVPDCRSRTERVDMLQLLDVSTMDAGGAGGFFDSNSILNHGC